MACRSRWLLIMSIIISDSLTADFPKDLHPMTQFSMAILALQKESKFAQAYQDGIHKTKYWEPTYEDVMDCIAKLPRIGACMFARMRVCMRPCVRGRVCMCACLRVRFMPAYEAATGCLSPLIANHDSRCLLSASMARPPCHSIAVLDG